MKIDLTTAQGLIAALEDEDVVIPLPQLEDQVPAATLLSALRIARNPGTKRFLSKLLGDRGAADAIPTLLSLLDDEEWEVRSGAADALGKIGIALRRRDEPVPAEIGERLEETYREGESTWLVTAMGAVGHHRAVPLLLNLLESDDPIVRAAAAWALGELRRLDALPALRRALAAETDAYARGQIAWALDQTESGRDDSEGGSHSGATSSAKDE